MQKPTFRMRAQQPASMPDMKRMKREEVSHTTSKVRSRWQYYRRLGREPVAGRQGWCQYSLLGAYCLALGFVDLIIEIVTSEQKRVARQVQVESDVHLYVYLSIEHSVEMLIRGPGPMRQEHRHYRVHTKEEKGEKKKKKKSYVNLSKMSRYPNNTIKI